MPKTNNLYVNMFRSIDICDEFPSFGRIPDNKRGKLRFGKWRQFYKFITPESYDLLIMN